MTPCWAKGFQLVAFVDRWLTNTSTISTYPRIGWMAAVGCAGCPHVDIFWQQHFPTRILHNLYNIIYIFTTHWFYQQWRRRWSADPRWIHHCPIWRYMPLGWNSGSRCASKILGILDIWGPVQISDPSAMLIILFIWIIWVWEWRNSKYPKRFVREVGPGHGKSFFWQTYMHPYISIQIHTYIYISIQHQIQLHRYVRCAIHHSAGPQWRLPALADVRDPLSRARGFEVSIVHGHLAAQKTWLWCGIKLAANLEAFMEMFGDMCTQSYVFR